MQLSQAPHRPCRPAARLTSCATAPTHCQLQDTAVLPWRVPASYALLPCQPCPSCPPLCPPLPLLPSRSPCVAGWCCWHPLSPRPPTARPLRQDTLLCHSPNATSIHTNPPLVPLPSLTSLPHSFVTLPSPAQVSLCCQWGQLSQASPQPPPSYSKASPAKSTSSPQLVNVVWCAYGAQTLPRVSTHTAAAAAAYSAAAAAVAAAVRRSRRQRWVRVR